MLGCTLKIHFSRSPMLMFSHHILNPSRCFSENGFSTYFVSFGMVVFASISMPESSLFSLKVLIAICDNCLQDTSHSQFSLISAPNATSAYSIAHTAQSALDLRRAIPRSFSSRIYLQFKLFIGVGAPPESEAREFEFHCPVAHNSTFTELSITPQIEHEYSSRC